MNVICTWGEGPDIVIDLNGKTLVLFEKPIMKGWTYGIVKEGTMDFNLDEAKELLVQLDKAIKETERMKKELEEYMDKTVSKREENDERTPKGDNVCVDS